MIDCTSNFQSLGTIWTGSDRIGQERASKVLERDWLLLSSTLGSLSDLPTYVRV